MATTGDSASASATREWVRIGLFAAMCALLTLSVFASAAGDRANRGDAAEMGHRLDAVDVAIREAKAVSEENRAMLEAARALLAATKTK